MTFKSISLCFQNQANLLRFLDYDRTFMTATLLYTYHFNAHATKANFAVKWSEDGTIAVLTTKGIYLLNVVPDCTIIPVNNFNLEVHFIEDLCQTSEDEVNPYLKGGIEQSEIFTNCYTRKQTYTACLERSLFPKRHCEDCHSVSTAFSNIEWSPPFHGTGTKRSVLATISLDYHGRIYGIEKGCQIIADLSKMLFDFYCEKGWQAVPDATSVNVVDAAKARAYRQSFIGFKWLQSDGNESCFLLTLQKDGCLFLWKIGKENKLVHFIDSGVNRPIYMETLCIAQGSFLLSIASLCGKVYLKRLSFTDDYLLLRYINVGILWDEEDELPAHHMILVKKSGKDDTSLTRAVNDDFILYAAKSSFLVGIMFQISEMNLLIRTFGSIVLPSIISAMTLYQSDTVLAGCESFNLKLVSMEEKGIVVRNFIIAQESTKFACKGIAKNIYISSLFCTQESIQVPYDHLVLRDPSKFSIYTTKSSVNEVFNEICDDRTPLSKKGALLEVLRYLVRQNNQTSLELFNGLKTSTALTQYRVIRWLALADLAQERRKNMKDPDKATAFNKVKSQCEMRIMKDYCLNILLRLTSRPSNKEEVLSAVLMCDFLLSLTGELVIDPELIGRQYELLGERERKPLRAREVCRFDKQGIELTTVSSGACPKHHSFERCPQSLRLCQSRPLRLCPWCRVTFRADTVFGMPSECTYCLAPLVSSND